MIPVPAAAARSTLMTASALPAASTTLLLKMVPATSPRMPRTEPKPLIVTVLPLPPLFVAPAWISPRKSPPRFNAIAPVKEA